MKAFLKWAGGKSRIASKIKEHLKDGQRLVEPFVGSGALFLSNSFDKYLLCDTNVDLINLYNLSMVFCLEVISFVVLKAGTCIGSKRSDTKSAAS